MTIGSNATGAPLPEHLQRFLFVAALAAVCVAVAGCPPPPLPTPEELLLKLSYAILLPEMTCEELRADFGLENLPVVDNPGGIGIVYEEHLLAAPWGDTIRLWYLPVPGARGTVVISCGNTGPMSCYLFTARMLTQIGWSVVMYDYQGFGGSSGPPWLGALRPDLEQAIDWTVARTGQSQVTLFGISLGSIPSVAVAAYRPEVVNGVVLDSPIALGYQIVRFGVFIRWDPEELVALLDRWLLSEAIIRNVKQPLLVYSHGQDFVADPDAVELLYQFAGGPKTIVRFEDLTHAQGQFLRTEEYQTALERFLNEVWPAPP